MSELIISLEDVRIFAHHGVFEHERRDGNEFEVNLSVRITASASSPTEDEITSTISYVDLWNVVKEEMAIPRKLLETVAISIVNKINATYTGIASIDCKITKLSPPIPAFMGKASVSFHVTNTDSPALS